MRIHTNDPEITKMPKAWDHLEEDVRRETMMTDFFLSFFLLIAVVT